MDKKLLLSKSMTGAFAVLTIALTVLGPLLVDLVCGWYAIPRNTLGNILLVSGYICSALAPSKRLLAMISPPGVRMFWVRSRYSFSVV